MFSILPWGALSMEYRSPCEYMQCETVLYTVNIHTSACMHTLLKQQNILQCLVNLQSFNPFSKSHQPKALQTFTDCLQQNANPYIHPPNQPLQMMIYLFNMNQVSSQFNLQTRIVCIRPKGRTQCIFPRSQHSCLYVYIYNKFSYDNNVYFSIFCEHRQLKHGIHVIDPSREVSSHCMTVQVGTSGYKWLQVVTSGFMWLKVVLCGFMWLSCFMWLSGFMWLNGCMWLSGFMWL